MQFTLEQSPVRSFRESCKQAMPHLVHVFRLGRLLKNQLKFPVAAAILDWEGRVHDGPFAGLRFPRSGTGNFAEMLGTYELSLTPVIERVISRNPELIIDVGAAWGYYAMGFAMRCPTAKVIAYEMDQTRADLMQKYIGINRLRPHIEVRGLCTVETLKADLVRQERPFLLMDVEGAEEFLLRPDIPGIERTEMVVELHEIFVPGITQQLAERFSSTHAIHLIEQADLSCHRPSPELLETISPFVLRFWGRLIKEDRKQPMTWMHLVPREAGE